MWLDSHDHLGAYGHISATWTLPGTQAQPPLAPVGPFSTRSCAIGFLVAGSAARGTGVLDLHLPCEGPLHAALADTPPVADSRRIMPRASARILATNTVSASLAVSKQIAGGRLMVGLSAGNWNAPSLVIAFERQGAAGGPLTDEAHFSYDRLGAGAGALLSGTAPSGMLRYDTAVASAHLRFQRRGPPQINRIDEICSSSVAGRAGADLRITRIDTTERLGVQGTVRFAVCGAVVQARFGKPDSAILASYRQTEVPLVSSPALVLVSPPAGATGVSRRPTIRLKLAARGTPVLYLGRVSAAPYASIEHDADFVPLEPPSYDAHTGYLTVRPAVTLAPYTRYKLEVMAPTPTGEVVSALRYFTTGG